MVLVKGIDVSKHQGRNFDFVGAKKAGYEFVILRIGCGKTKDIYFEENYTAAILAGLKVAVYHYTYSTTEAQGIQDATRVLGWLNNRPVFAVTYDVEDGKQKSTTRKVANAEMYNAFANRVKSKGYQTMIYSGEYFFNNYFSKGLITDPLWIAKYSSKVPNVGKEVHIWQWTSDAIQDDFYKKKLDRNYLLKDVFGITTDTPVEVMEINPYPVPSRNLKRTYPIMMKGNDVKWLQWELAQRCFLPEKDIDGKFGNQTLAAVKAYQKPYGLKVDGIVGPATRYSLLND
ncbi:MAG: hypothetical protein E7299_07615 [Lachnospiraceae bacterium]|nr:hypothetical protein [Lachnospiraceae bacterium]